MTSFISSDWWLIFIIGPMVGGALQRHHSRRLRLLAAKGELEERRRAAQAPPPEPQAICGCGHHLSFHNPRTGSCAEDDCRCQQYVGPEPLGHVFAQPLIDPDGNQITGSQPTGSQPDAIGPATAEAGQA